MLRVLLALVAGAAAAGCGSAEGPPRQAPIANTAGVAAGGSPCELGWLERTERLIVTDRSGGPFGYFELRAELAGRGPALTGTARGQTGASPSRRGAI